MGRAAGWRSRWGSSPAVAPPRPWRATPISSCPRYALSSTPRGSAVLEASRGWGQSRTGRERAPTRPPIWPGSIFSHATLTQLMPQRWIRGARRRQHSAWLFVRMHTEEVSAMAPAAQWGCVADPFQGRARGAHFNHVAFRQACSHDPGVEWSTSMVMMQATRLVESIPSAARTPHCTGIHFAHHTRWVSHPPTRTQLSPSSGRSSLHPAHTGFEADGPHDVLFGHHNDNGVCVTSPHDGDQGLS
jgi:hypothetical protein